MLLSLSRPTAGVQAWFRVYRSLLRRDLWMRYAWMEWVLPFEGASLLAALAVYFFLAQSFGGQAPFLRAYGGDYVGYLIIGVAGQALLGHATSSVYSTVLAMYRGSWTSSGVRLAMADYVEMAQLPLSAYICAHTAWGYIQTFLRIVIYLVAGAAVFGMRPHADAQYGVAVAAIALGVAACIGISLISAGMIWLLGAWHGNEPTQWALATIVPLTAGVYFPSEALPPLLRTLAELLPQTHALRAARFAALGGSQYDMAAALPEIGILAASAAGLLLVGGFLFRRALRMARVAGSLSA